VLTLVQLEYAVAVEKFRHFGLAAKACHVSQPTLSQQLQKLEDTAGIILFDRLQKPILPTPEGALFIEQAKVVLREQRKLTDLSKESRSKELSGDFALGVIPTISGSLLPLFLHAFALRYKAVNLVIEELKTESILQELKEDRLDGAILSTPIADTGLKMHPLYYESFVLYLSKDHELLKKKVLNAADIDGSELWMLQEGNCFKNQVEDFCSWKVGRRRPPNNIRFQSGSLETLKNLVRRHSGYTMIPELMALGLPAAEQKAHIREIHGPTPTREVSFIYRRDHWKLSMIQAIESAIVAGLPPGISRVKKAQQKLLEHC
jgi:LysR family transcriptional regulator, hydrogen peroxide-inducible genes activator